MQFDCVQLFPCSINYFYLAQMEVVQRHLRLRVDVLQVPAEALALEAVAEAAALSQVADLNVARTLREEIRVTSAQ